MNIREHSYLELVYLVTALVPSDTACLANSPGRRRRTAVWISRDVMVDLEINTNLLRCYDRPRAQDNQHQSKRNSPLVVMGQLTRLCSDPLEQVIDEGVHDGHGLRGDSSVGVNLLQDL